MRKTLGFITLAGLAAVAAARLLPAGITDFAKALQGAQSLKTSYTVQTIGEAPEKFSVELKKPNLLRVETPTQLFVSDGKELTTLDKSDGVYYKQPASDALLTSILTPEPLNVWAGFFNPKALSPVTSKSLCVKTRGGQPLEAVEATYDSKGDRIVTYFLDSADKLARQAQVDLKSPGGKKTLVINAKDLLVNGASDSDAFAFKAPNGSRQTTLEELSADKWFTDLEQAKAMAAKTGKRIFVDFMAEWCGPCKMLEREVLNTPKFRELAKKKLVLLRIDVDEQKSVAAMFNIEAMPTQLVLDKTGSVLAKTVGYGGPDAFYAFIIPNAG